ncbi:T9SS type A sorting domain-containing protein [Crocinitomix algicola]|uniref:T9SS type A sorting domain-containing protein n=1 Tax=Crocinitomix algicola TaxID=1740263 RepID=UPI00082F76B7|nr:T9SS type A sorting domain-containing protein [Crocinitomix algicola]
MKKLLFAVALACFGFGHAQNKSILYIGNSYTGVNNLPLLVYNIAVANSDTITYDSNTPGGSRFEMHKTNPTTLAKINSKNWDFVVLQDQSQIPALPEDIMGEFYSPPNAAVLVDSIKENSICTEVVFYMTWGRKYGDATFCEDHPPVCTYEGMQDELAAAYTFMAEENNATVSPVGEAWRAVINDDPSIELYTGDESHPNINGSYLAACVMYATMYQKPSSGNTYTAGIEPDLAAYLQEKADEVVFGELETWRIGHSDLHATYDYTNEAFEYNFTSSTENAETVKWIIDGVTYLEENPSHSFPTDGFYSVTFMAYNECDTIILNENLPVGDVGIPTPTELDLKIFPNPTNDYIYISTHSKENIQVELYDLKGRLLINTLINSNYKLDIRHMNKGIYFLKVNGTVKQIVKT